MHNLFTMYLLGWKFCLHHLFTGILSGANDLHSFLIHYLSEIKSWAVVFVQGVNGCEGKTSVCVPSLREEIWCKLSLAGLHYV